MADWEANVRRVVPYTPGEQPKRNDIIKLNTNECPYPPAPGVTKALQEFEADKLRLYPDPAALELREAIAAAVSVLEHPVTADQVFVGVGSDDVLALAFLTFFNSKKPILFPDITYSFYDVWADLYGIPYRTPELDEKFRLKKEDYLTENGGIIFPNPNAPTGLMENLDTIEEIVAKNPDSVVIVDEAYVDFGGVSALPLVDKYENLLVVQTFSKSRALAGMRIGFAIGQKKLISYLNDVKFSFNSYTMNRLTIACGKACVEDRAYFQEITGKIVATREWTKQKLTELGFGGLPVCMAKTQYSLSDNPDLLGRPEGFEINVREAYVSAGAGFVVVLTGAVMTMPGLPKTPAAFSIDVDEDGRITGLF